MRPDGLDRILSTEPEIVPSSGFARAVMDGVRRETGAPGPIPFPWTRALPGMAALIVSGTAAIRFGIAQITGTPSISAGQVDWISTVARILHETSKAGAPWIAGALLLALATSIVSMRVASPPA
jgi:hypothetical protein